MRLSNDKWVAQMNDWGRAGRPFLFSLNYKATEAQIWPLNQVPAHVFYALPQRQKMPPLRPLPARIEFEPQAMAQAAYEQSFEYVLNELKAGNSYLLNLCHPTPLRTNLQLHDFFSRAQAPYKILIEGEFCCFSPEAFVRIQGREISTYPMKGTGSDAAALLANEKEAAEHATVVDLLRNDLSMVAQKVRVPRYRYLEELQTARGRIYQSSSEIKGELPENWPAQLGSILARLSPAGSITGAPKARTMQIIAEAEQGERGYYTGIFGCFDGQSLQSAVSIRFIEQTPSGLVYRSGGGITAMSQAAEEYRELIQKVYVPFTY